MFDVYIPIEGSRLRASIDPKSAIVGSPANAWLERGAPAELGGGEPIEDDPSDPQLVIDFEGARYGQVNMVTFADRCLHAAGRHKEHYPTVARRIVPRTELERVGTYIYDMERVEIEDGLTLVHLARWLGLTSEGDTIEIDTDQLHAELRGTSPRAVR